MGRKWKCIDRHLSAKEEITLFRGGRARKQLSHISRFTGILPVKREHGRDAHATIFIIISSRAQVPFSPELPIPLPEPIYPDRPGG